ncbi:MAG: hypothetical protein U0264_15110 [Candidatus Kapaibacterium sp.]
MLHTYLDGELDQTHEKPLFEELAQNQELRAEMRDLLAIRAAVQHDVEAFSPPIAATNNVFSTLGFTMPASAPIAAPAPVLTTGVATVAATTSWWSRLWLPTTTLLIGAGITYLLLQWGYSSALAAKDSKYADQIQHIRSEADKAIDLAKKSAAPALHAAEPQVIIKKVYYPVVKYKEIPGATPSQSETANSGSGNDVSAGTLSSEMPIVLSTPLRSTEQSNRDGASILGKNNASVYFASSVSTPNQQEWAKSGESTDEFQAHDTPSLWIKLSQNAASISATTSTNLPPQEAFLNNFNGELGWMLTPSLSLGVKVGREAFPMSYYGVTNGRTSRYEQYSALLWGGLSADVRPTELSFFGGIQPYFSGVAGGSELGPLVRGETGLLFQITSQIGLSAGSNATGMFYQFQGTNFSTWKFGVTTGITFHF